MYNQLKYLIFFILFSFATATVAGTLFSDDFEDGNANGWTEVGGTWSVITDGSKVYKQTDDAVDARSKAGSVWSGDITAEFRVKPLSFRVSNSRVNVYPRWVDDSNYYFVSLMNGNIIKLRKSVNGTWTLLDSKSYTVSTGTWYTVKVTITGSTITVYINDVQELTANDGTHTSGQIGVGMNDATGEFDDVNISDTEGPTQYSLTVNTSGSGSVILNPSGGTYDDGTVVTLTANPSSGWQFESWSGALSGTTNPETINMNSDKTVTATFTESGGGTLFSDDFEDGVADGWTEVGGNWSVVTDGSKVYKQTNDAVDARSKAGSAWSGDITAEFRVKPLSFSASNGRLNVYPRWVDDTSYYFVSLMNGDIIKLRKSVGGTWTLLDSKSYTVNTGTWYTVKVTITGSTITVYINGVQELTANDGTHTSGQIGVGMNFATGEFDDIDISTAGGGPNQYSLTVNTSGSGSVNLNPSGGTYDEGTIVTLTANPDAGNQFDNWNGDLTGTANPETITMNANKTVTANFSPIQYTLTVNTSGSGSVNLNPSGGTYDEGTIVTLTANPDAGNQFDNWSGDLTGTTNPETITMNTNKTITANFSPIQYNLTINTSGSGSVNFNPSGGTYDDGTIVTLTANPDAGNQFDNWSGDLTGTANPETITMNTNKTITANFSPIQYNLTINTSGDGSVSLNPSGATYDSGTIVTLTANPDAGNQFDNWTGDLTGTANPATITMNSNKTVTANFSPIQYTLTVNTSGSGSVNLNPSGGTYDEGTIVTLTANPSSGWHFDSWSGALSGTANPETITMNSNKTVTATFTESGGGSLFSDDFEDGNANGWTEVGGTWSVVTDGSKVYKQTDNTTWARSKAGSSWSGDITAEFKVKPLSYNGTNRHVNVFLRWVDDSNFYFVSLMSENQIRLRKSINGAWTILDSKSYTVSTGTWYTIKVTISGSTLTVYINGVQELSASDGTHTSGQIGVGMNYATAEFDDVNVSTPGGGPTQYSLTVNTSGSGSVDLNPSGGTYDEGTVITLTANPSSGWQFDNWSGDLTGTANPETITMNSNKTVTALFSETSPTQYTLTVNTSGSGSVNLNPSGGTYDDGTVVTLTANPSSGWQFDNWTGALSGTANPKTITMNTNKTVTANFSEQGGGGETSVSQRINSRTFPSVFQAWGGVTNLPGEDPQITRARHDLIWNGIGDIDGLVWDTDPVGGWRILATGFTAASIVNGQAFRQELLGYNPNIVLLANLNYRGAKASWLPNDHEWWMRDGNGNKIVAWQGAETWYRLDFFNSEFRTQVATWAVSAINSGVYDGVILDWWDESISSEWPSRLALLQEIRSAITDTCIIIVNANKRLSTGSKSYINGVFMETGKNIPDTPAKWSEIQNALEWNQANVQEPKLVCLETWYDQSMNEPDRMRATTTMSLTLSNGYCLFAEPNAVAGVDHRHWWWDFWDKSLGQAVGAGSLQGNGTYMREFDNGYAVYNPMGNGTAQVSFSVNYTSLRTGNTAKNHNVPDMDGDIFLVPGAKTSNMPEQIPQQTPVDFSLSQNYPNPFNPVTNIRFSIPDDGNVNLSIYNMLGEEIKTLVDGHKSAGVFDVEWDGTNNAGRKITSGIYLYKLQMGSKVQMKKMLFMK